jgi:hypothetical protein
MSGPRAGRHGDGVLRSQTMVGTQRSLLSQFPASSWMTPGRSIGAADDCASRHTLEAPQNGDGRSRK